MVAHFLFVLFVILGALAVLWRPWIAWLHVPSALYGATLEFIGWVCPLTPVEQGLRRLAGQGGYEGGFIEHYIGGLLYPGNWHEISLYLGIGVVAINVILYVVVLTR